MNSRMIIIEEASDKEKEISGEHTANNQIAIFIHLHYLDTLEKYFCYIDNIPDEIPVYVSTSSKEVEIKVQEYAFMQSEKRVEIVYKKNRGRDITAFLVALREKIIQYKYFCFLHDKKEKRESQKEDVEQWIDNLWGNLLGTKDPFFFWNVISLFENNDDLGLLAPPEPMGESFHYDNGWGELNILLTRELAGDLNLHVEINRDMNQQPVTLGTCFWARKDALSKLLVKSWKYEDFDDEPLPDCGKCYAVERILGYVVADAGYIAGNIMSDRYAEKYIQFLMESRRRAFEVLDQRYAICTLYELKKLEEVCRYFDQHKKVYLYGAGKVGKGLCRYFYDTNRKPKGFIVSEKTSEQICLSLPVKSIEEIFPMKDMGIIVSVAGDKVNAITDELDKRGISDYFCVTK